ncbi:hypothetical protein KI387_011774, partial [Taxus chinensis]
TLLFGDLFGVLKDLQRWHKKMKTRSQSNTIIPLETPTWTVCIRNIQYEEEFCRRQFVIHVLHHRRPNLSRDEIKEELYKKFKVRDMRIIFLSSFRTNKTHSKGFGLIYDTMEDAIRFEPRSKLMKNRIEVANPRAKKNCLNRAKKGGASTYMFIVVNLIVGKTVETSTNIALR